MVEREPRGEANPSGESILAKEFVETILRAAKENLRQDGYLVPALVVHLTRGERGIIVLQALPETTAEKQAYFTALGRSIRWSGKSIHEAVFVSESWYVSAKDKQGLTPDVRPSQHPDRKEAITLVGRDAERSHQTFVIQPFSRDSENKPVFGAIEVEEYNTPADERDVRASGLVDYLFPRRAPLRRRSGLNGMI